MSESPGEHILLENSTSVDSEMSPSLTEHPEAAKYQHAAIYTDVSMLASHSNDDISPISLPLRKSSLGLPSSQLVEGVTTSDKNDAADD